MEIRFYFNNKVYLRRHRYTFKNGQGMEVDVITFGCYITSIRVPDRDGQLSDVALGFDKLSSNNFSALAMLISEGLNNYSSCRIKLCLLVLYSI